MIEDLRFVQRQVPQQDGHTHEVYYKTVRILQFKSLGQWSDVRLEDEHA